MNPPPPQALHEGAAFMEAKLSAEERTDKDPLIAKLKQENQRLAAEARLLNEARMANSALRVTHESELEDLRKKELEPLQAKTKEQEETLKRERALFEKSRKDYEDKLSDAQKFYSKNFDENRGITPARYIAWFGKGFPTEDKFRKYVLGAAGVYHGITFFLTFLFLILAYNGSHQGNLQLLFVETSFDMFDVFRTTWRPAWFICIYEFFSALLLLLVWQGARSYTANPAFFRMMYLALTHTPMVIIVGAISGTSNAGIILGACSFLMSMPIWYIAEGFRTRTWFFVGSIGYLFPWAYCAMNFGASVKHLQAIDAWGEGIIFVSAAFFHLLLYFAQLISVNINVKLDEGAILFVPYTIDSLIYVFSTSSKIFVTYFTFFYLDNNYPHY